MLPPNRQPTRIHSPAASLSARATPAIHRAREEYIVNAHILLGCHCAEKHSMASAAMPVRRGARPGREHRHTLDVRIARLCAFRMHGEASRRGPAPALWVLQASTRSRRARACVGVRVSRGPSLPRPVFRYTTERAGRLGGGARPRSDPRGGTVSRALHRPEARQSRLGTAERRLCGAL